MFNWLITVILDIFNFTVLDNAVLLNHSTSSFIILDYDIFGSTLLRSRVLEIMPRETKDNLHSRSYF